jgi:hypothetical protein
MLVFVWNTNMAAMAFVELVPEADECKRSIGLIMVFNAIKLNILLL